MIEFKNSKTVVNCPNCGKEYNMEEYYKLEKEKPDPAISVYGKAAPKEALEEISQKTNSLYWGEILYKERVDIFDDKIYDARICSVCNTGFGFVKIVGNDKGSLIFELDLDLSQ
jgi:hypothetical protein